MIKNRVAAATSIGVILGISCWFGGVYLFGYEYTPLQISNIILHRAVMGFVIGISSLKMNWGVHGILVGSVVGILFIFYDILAGYPLWIGLVLIGVNAFYGFSVELVTTKLFGLRLLSKGSEI